MKRVSGWDQKLHAYTRAAMSKLHAWGTHDCCMFAAGAVQAQTGEDFAAEFRGKYSSEAEAYALLADLGYMDVGALAASRLPEIEVREAQRGDVVMGPGDFGDFLGVCDGRTLVGPTDRGLLHWPMSIATRAWRVG